MWQQNVDVARRRFELFARGDTEAALRSVDPAVETFEGPALPGASTYSGHAGLARAYDHWAGQWMTSTWSWRS